jgi:putative membrane protein
VQRFSCAVVVAASVLLSWASAAVGWQGRSSDLSSADKTFMTSAAAADRFEIMTSNIALSRGDADTKELARKIIADHKRSSAALQRIAHRFGVKLPAGLSPAKQQQIRGLVRASGNAFSRTYSLLQVAAHLGAIALYAGEKQNGRDRTLRAFAASTLPLLRMHLQMARKLTASSP